MATAAPVMMQPLSPKPPAPAAHAPADPAEVAAVEAVLAGKVLPRLRLGSKALASILKDPEDTKQVFILFLVLHARRVPGFLARFMAEPGGAELMAERPAIDSHGVDFDALRKLPADTLGGAFARHLDDRGLSPDIFQAPPGVPPAIGYLAQRMRQSHDIWHVLTGYDTSVPGELALQAFTFAQTRMPGPALLAVTGALRWWPEERGVFGLVARGYRRGKAARSLLAVRWEDLWAVPLATVRAELGIAA
ncbi:MAG: Coq4 family protein [Myxococcota bacterium]